MKYAVRKEPIREVHAVKEKKSHSSTVWNLCLIALLAGGNAIAFMKMWGNLSPGMGSVLIPVFLMVVFTAMVEYLKKNYPFARALILLPWLFLLVVTGWGNLYNGMKMWSNLMISTWNQIHESGVAVFQVQVSDAGILAFSIAVALLIGMAGYLLIKGHHTVFCFVYECIWFYLLLSGNIFEPLAGGCMLAAFVGLCISMKKQSVTRRGFLWLGIVAIVLCTGSGVTKQTEMEEIQQARENLQNWIHIWRYGEDVLPEGNIREANELKAREEEMLTVSTEQEKNLYLRGFVGSIYQEGIWLPLSDSAYGGDNSGMLKWLKKRAFDPLNQSASYRKLEDEEKNTENQVQVTVVGASSYYAYVPVSVLEVTDGRLKEDNDTRYTSKGFFGEREYTYEEKSGTRPSELTVTGAWVSNPETDSQKQYSEAEAVYRNFVYENYVSVDSGIYNLMNQIFWDDYETENDGIYSALNQVRNRLSENLSYVDEPEAAPEEEDPIIWGLTDAHEGNDVLFTSVAVQALRTHGIPARYVEGYYLASDDVAESTEKTVTLTGKDSHAWVEVYFDGVGWQPVDVTPGYYYDALSLRNMINTPDTEHKSAAIQNQGNDIESSTKLEDGNNGKGSKLAQKVWNITAIMIGILTILLLIICLCFLILEIGRVVFAWLEKKKYLQSDQKHRVLFLEQSIFAVLTFVGIRTSLGWKTKEVDEMLSHQFENIKLGEFERTCELIERSVYGDMELKPNEMRTIQIFLTKIRTALREGSNRRAKIMLHYEWIYRKWIMKKSGHSGYGYFRLLIK